MTTATITAEKGPDGIRIRRSHLHAIVIGLAGIDPGRLPEIGAIVKQDCTISNAIHAAVEISYEVQADRARNDDAAKSIAWLPKRVSRVRCGFVTLRVMPDDGRQGMG